MKIPLFDIDWTLLKGGNTIHHRAFDYAFKQIYNVNASIEELSLHGMIDNEIIIEVLKSHHISQKVAKEKLQKAVSVMTKYFLDHCKEESPVVLPGVIEILTVLQQNNIPIGVLTGNIETIGWKKLELAGIKDFFTFGSFGNMAYQRKELIPIAKDRCNKRNNTDYQIKDFVIVGDSPRDIACAKAGGIEVIAVGSGTFTKAQLEEYSPDITVSSLEEKESVVNFLKG